jgi:diaminopimelate decarboxylase
MSFVIRDGYLFCEGVRVVDTLSHVERTPFYLYSLAVLSRNYRAWADALDGVPSVLCYAVKANNNLSLLRHLKDLGCGATLVSGGELRLALDAGFDPATMVFNGNGKTMDELTAAVEAGVRLNVDSEFDLTHIEAAASVVGHTAELLVRINPDIDPKVHPYVSTGVRISKFGIRREELDGLLDRIRESQVLRLVGLHCHLGSTIADVSVFAEATKYLADVTREIRSAGHEVRFINIGGGLGIQRGGDNEASPKALVDAVRPLLPDDATLVVEPGRSIVADTAVLITRVIGVKRGAERRFIVVDGSMTELIRPSLYDAHHDIGFVEPVDGSVDTFDVVGPVCESADFLGKDRRLPVPPEGTGVVVYDAGAYGFSMSSNYNIRPRPPEYLVSGHDLTCIRPAETYEDFRRTFGGADVS